MSLDQIGVILPLSIGPVIVISGAGLVLLSMTNRYGRVIDRSRSLSELARRVTGADSDRLQPQLRILTRRARLLRSAIALAALCILFAALLVISLFVLALLDVQAPAVPVVLFVSCMACLIVGLVLFIVDINMSLAALALDIADSEQPGRAGTLG